MISSPVSNIKSCIVSMLCLSSLSYAFPVKATENGNEHYPLGLNTANTGMLLSPVPGATVYYDYNVFVTADKFADNNGKSEIPGFKLSSFAHASLFTHNWTNIDDVSIGTGAVLVVQDTHVDVGHTKDSRTALADPMIMPIMVSWGSPTLKTLLALDVWVPVGAYDKTQPASPGLNYWTFAPNLGLTWLPNPKTEVSISALMQFNTENKKTDYKSGNDIGVDYMVGYRPFDNQQIQVGLSGYLYKQWTDDEVNGDEISGHRGQVFAFGPQLRYDLAGHRGGLVVKWQHEVEARNRPEGDRIWFQFAIPL